VQVVWIGTLKQALEITTSHLYVAHAPLDPIFYTEGKSVQKETYINKHLWRGI
jgi:hypothetical protein